MTTAVSALLRLDLIKRYWPYYLAVSALTVTVQVALVVMIGVSTSPDFVYRYDPGAKTLLYWVGLYPSPAELNPYAWARVGYMLFVAACYAVWGVGNSTALVYTQLALVWLVQPLMFHVLLHTTGRLMVSVIAMGVYLTFYDAYLWNTWALTDALYRLIVLAAFFLLLRLWQENNYRVFAVVAVVATLVASTFRVETVLYALPALGLAVYYSSWSRARLIAVGAAVGTIALIALAPLVGMLTGLVGQWFSSGTIFLSVDAIEGLSHLAPPAEQTPATMVAFGLHVMVLRAWYSITPFPAYWSGAHQLYYAAYMLPCYALVAVGSRDAWRTRNSLWFISLWVFVASVLLRMLTHVDSPLRYAYTPLVFLFFCAVWSWVGWREQHGASRGNRLKRM